MTDSRNSRLSGIAPRRALVFFSSRRRHTRSDRDWSSDVCSSDLGALDAALKYTTERQQFGKPVAEFQGVQFQLAQAATELEAARLMVYNAARLEDVREPYTMEAAMAKLYASQVAERVTSLCVELFGGYGDTQEYPVEKFYRDAKIGTIYEGTSNMQLHTIAKMLLK